jgi:hypothetical protein
LATATIATFYLYSGHDAPPRLIKYDVTREPEKAKNPFYNVRVPKELEEANQFTFTLDGKRYTKDQLVIDFFQAAFPRHLWREEYLLEDDFFILSLYGCAVANDNCECENKWCAARTA